MSNTPHTHGPWRVVPVNAANSITDYDIEHDCEELGVITIATVNGEPPEAEGNARIIGAALTSFDALKLIMGISATTDEEEKRSSAERLDLYDTILADIQRIAVAAIRKAQGVQL